MMNRRHFSNDQAIAAASPSMGAYRRSASVQNLLPANTMCHPSGQHTGAFSVGHVQCFCKFKIDWDVFTKMTNLSDTQMNVQLYNCAEETVQNSIINTYPEFFNADPSKLLDMLEVLDRRIVIPKPLRKKILHCLHSAHQGVDGMKARANDSVYWPGMNASIRNFRANCSICTTIAPSQPREPITMTPSPEWPFQQIVMDIFHVGHVTYLACADRLTGWLILYNLKPGHATTSKLMSICRQLFQTYGTPEEISTDGGQPFTSTAFQEFLQTWGIKHRRSSVAYPQSNGRAELAVKTAKRIVNGNTDAQGSLDNDKAARAILQYRNTPIQGIGLSPAQLLLHRRLRDSIPLQPFLYKPHPVRSAMLNHETHLFRLLKCFFETFIPNEVGVFF